MLPVKSNRKTQQVLNALLNRSVDHYETNGDGTLDKEVTLK